MKIKAIVFDVGQTLSNQLDKGRLEERNKNYYKYVHEELLRRNFVKYFPNLYAYTSERFVEELNTLNMGTRAEKNRSTEVLKEYRMSEQTLDVLISYENTFGTSLEKSQLGEALAELDQVYSSTEALDEGVYELWPDTKDTLIELKAQGYILCLASNTAHPVKHEHMLQRLGITPLIDHFAVSSYIGVRKPNPEMISYLLNKIKLTPEEIIVVGDLLDRDILMGNLAGARTVWINAIPYSLDQNLKRITEGDQKYLPTAGIVCLAQLIPTLNYIQNLSPGPGQVRVGYYFPSIRKKLETGKQGAFVSNERVFYMPIELRAPIEHLGDFDVIVHKITDLLLSGDPKDRDGVVNLQNYISSRPNVLILDPVDGLQYTNSRKAFLTMWKTANVNGVNVRCPLVYSGNQISFPCIIKTDVACQLKGSHDMAVVHTQEAYDKALSRFFLPVVVQEWISCEAMYKVYILGDRYSISNQQFLSVDQEELHFNSTNIPDGVLNKNITLDQEVVKKINWTLKENTGLGMLSYDLALEKGTGDYVLIDLNYFPGYYTMSDYKDAMDDYIIQSYTRFRNKLG